MRSRTAANLSLQIEREFCKLREDQLRDERDTLRERENGRQIARETLELLKCSLGTLCGGTTVPVLGNSGK